MLLRFLYVIAVATLLVVVFVSLIVARVATVALTATGMSKEMARFQARSALTGTGFTTKEAESVVGHPVRRRIVMWLMLFGSAGLVAVLGSLMIGFVGSGRDWAKIAMLLVGLGAILALARSPLADRWLTRVIGRLLARYSDLDVRDYVSLLHLRGDYQVTELRVDEGDWLCGKTLREASLRDEGVAVLAVERQDGAWRGDPTGETAICPGDTLTLYGRTELLKELDRRPGGVVGDEAHSKAIEAASETRDREEQEDTESEGAETSTPQVR